MVGYLQKRINRHPQIGPPLFSGAVSLIFFSRILQFEAPLELAKELNLLYIFSILQQALLSGSELHLWVLVAKHPLLGRSLGGIGRFRSIFKGLEVV